MTDTSIGCSAGDLATARPGDLLRRTRLLAGLPAPALADLENRVALAPVPAGAVLCRQGDAGDAAYLVVTGRFRVEREGSIIGEIGRGELVGEMALLTGEPRTGTVTAMRESTVLVLEADVFADVLANHEGCYRSVSEQLVGRLQAVLTATTTKANRASIVALLSDGRSASGEAAHQIAAHLGGGVAVVENQPADLAPLEANHRIVVLVPDPADSPFQRWALRNSDRAALVVDASSPPAGGLGREVVLGDRTGRLPELVLVHPASTGCPAGTRTWLDVYGSPAHHHVRRGLAGDAARVARRLTGRERVLVLSGGGARGLAHAGLWRALADHELGVDAVVGTSAGAVAAAVFGLGHDHEAAGRLAMDLFASGRHPIDLTVPTTSLAAGDRLASRLRELCGHQRTFEDLWLELTIVSSNLTTSGVHIHRSGSLHRALQASTAIPGVFPPVVEPDGVLVDGGVVANLPLDVARRLHPGAVLIASDAGKRLGLSPEDFPPGQASSEGWRQLRSRLRRRRGAPGMIRVLSQLTALGGAGTTAEPADLHIDFDLSGFGLFDFRKGRHIIDAGYEQASAELATLLDRADHPFAEPDDTTRDRSVAPSGTFR